METKKKGTLYGISVGPGDGGQVTLQAVQYMKQCDVILLPAATREECQAYRIAVKAWEGVAGKEYRCYDFPMTRDQAVLEKCRKQIYENIRSILSGGLSAGFLVLGDLSVYSTYSYMEECAKQDGFFTRTASGVTSFCASAGQLGIPLVSEGEQLHIIPGSANLEGALGLSGTKVFMKLGKKTEELLGLLKTLEEKGAVKVYAVVHCGMEQEQICEGVDAIPLQAGYFTTVIVKEI